jgi:hypothetical protein
MEKEPRKNPIVETLNVKSEYLGTVGNLIKLTQSLEYDPKREIIFYWEYRKGNLHAAPKDFMTIAKINELLEKLSPYQELPNKLFIHISERT